MVDIETESIPQCFISYSWDSEPHKAWVRNLADQLQRKGVSTFVDQWDVHPGTDLAKYMSSSIKDSQFVLLVCTPKFAAKADAGKGGVGFETTIVTGEIYTTASEKKFIPILREGEIKDAFPAYLKTRAYIDFRDSQKFAESLEDLLRYIHKKPRYIRPKLGARPSFTVENPPAHRELMADVRVVETDEEASENDFDLSLFLNVPFDSDYQSLLQVAAFTVLQCGLRPRSLLEVHDAGSTRIQRILALVSECKYSIHDISRSGHPKLPGLNIPLELGVTLGAMRFDRQAPSKRSVLVLDAEIYRYQNIMSDLSGFDVRTHQNDPLKLTKVIRDWLKLALDRRDLPPASSIWKSFAEFNAQSLRKKGLSDLSYNELIESAKEWLSENEAVRH